MNFRWFSITEALGVARKFWTMAELRQVAFYAEEGLSGGRTANLIGRSRNAVLSAAHRHGIEFRGDSGPPFDNRNRVAKFARGRTREQRDRDEKNRRRINARLSRRRRKLATQQAGD